ncbi:MAG TPA: type II secretion system F family protein [Candidatus Saccharimonadales bacterium]|nr:type II secretion system F family protein [Candidatus Saccharimonadales bacterium]
MLVFEYTAKDSNSNKEVKSQVQAESEVAAARLLMRQGIIPIKIHMKDDDSDALFSFMKKRVKTKDRIIMTRQLSTLINAGLPLTQSLRTVAAQTDSKPLVIVINDILSSVEGGSSLSAALAKHPNVFNEVYIALVSAGETSGTLDQALERIANQQEKDAEMLSKVRGAMIYPAIVLVVIGFVIAFMLIEVLPQVKGLYKSLGLQLPFLTAMMLSIANAAKKFWWLVILLIVALVYFLRRYSKTVNGRAAIDTLKMRAPAFGPLFMKLYMARFCRTGETLMATGVPMLEMLRISGKAVANVQIERSIMRASEKVKGGKTLSEAIKNDDNFLPLVPQMISIGEQSGAIDKMMGKAATFYENELDNAIKSISTIIEPALMVVLAVVAGLLVGAILLPIYGLVGQNLNLG